MTKRQNFGSLSEALDAVQSNVMDSAFENIATNYLQSLGFEDRWKFLEALLTSPQSKVRALGLRVARRGVREIALLERIVLLSFAVDRFSELQYWYATILARYPFTRFGHDLRREMERRGDANFAVLHLRALEMHRAKGNKAKKTVVEGLKKFAIDRALSS